MGRTSGGQVCVNADLKGCLSSLCHLSVIFERERERERAFGFWYVLESRVDKVVVWQSRKAKRKVQSEDREKGKNTRVEEKKRGKKNKKKHVDEKKIKNKKLKLKNAITIFS